MQTAKTNLYSLVHLTLYQNLLWSAYIHFLALHSIFVFIFGAYITGGVHISKGPADVYVEIGEMARFPCHYEGTQTFPFWKIGVTLYTTLYLPPHHHYNHLKQELFVR